MQVKTVSVTYERKLNLGDFNSAHVGLTVWADVEDDDDLDAVMRGLWEMTTANVKAKAAEFTPKIGVSLKSTFLGVEIADNKAEVYDGN